MKFVQLQELAQTASGGTPPRGNKQYYGGDIPWLKSGELPDGEIKVSEESITPLALERSNAKLLPTGTLLIAMYGATVGRLGILTFPAATNQAVCAITPNAKLDRDYLFYWLFSIRRNLVETSFGGAQPNISQSVIRELQVPWVPILRQRQIAARLKAQLAEVETARQAAQMQVREAGLLRQRLLQQAFDALGDVPCKVLGDWARTTSGATPSRSDKRYWEPSEIAWVKTGEIDFAPIVEVREFISRTALKECSLELLPAKTVLIAITGEGRTRGRSAVLEIPATTNQHSVAILPNDTWLAEFLQLWLQRSYEDLRELSEGRGGSRSALSGGQIKALEIPAPSIDEQNRIATQLKTQLSQAQAIAQAAQAQLAEIERLPQRLLAQAFDNLEERE